MLTFLRTLFSSSAPEPAAGPSATARLGALGEQLVADWLMTNGYRIVATNFTAPIGRSLRGRPVTGEIDLIAFDESEGEAVLSFIEVKTRSSADFAAPETAVDRRKQRQITRASRVYRRVCQMHEEPTRFVVASVLIIPGAAPQINLFRDYFRETRFQRSGWFSRW